MRRALIMVVVGLFLVGAGTAAASNGCIEISSVNVGTAGNITAPGCYVLTSDLTQPVAISGVANVTLDLNGFSITTSSTPAIFIAGFVDSLEVRNGTLVSQGISIDASGSAGGTSHVFRDLRIYSSSDRGIVYNLSDGILQNLQLENVVIFSMGTGVEIMAVAGNNSLTNMRVHRCEIRSMAMFGISVLGGGATSMKVHGFQVESSTIASEGGTAAVYLDTAGVTGTSAADGEFQGSIRSSDLSAPDSGGMGVVAYNATAGVLHCSDNNVVATTTGGGTGTEYAFWAPGPVFITVTHNTTQAATGTPLSAISGSVYSPIIGSDGTNNYFSNFDPWVGPY